MKATFTLHKTGQVVTAELKQSPQYVVHFNRLPDYDGEFGFDWMRKEYLPTNEGGQGFCVEGLEELKKVYTPFKVDLKHSQTQQPYGNYYVPWLSMFPNHKEKIGKEVELFVTIAQEYTSAEFYTNTEEEFFSFEVSDPVLRVEPSKISADEAINGVKIIIYCDAPLQEDAFIEVKSSKKALVGKLNVMRNANSEKNILNLRMVYVKRSEIKNDIQNIENEIAKIGGYKGLEDYLNKKILNQSLIQCKIYTEDPNFGKLDKLDFSEETLKKVDVINSKKELKEGAFHYFRERFKKLYPTPADRKGVFIFLTNFDSIDANGSGITYPKNANSLIMYSKGLDNKEVYAHEIGHILGLLHSFLDKKSDYSLISIQDKIIEANNAIVENREKLKKEEKSLKTNLDYKKKNSENSIVEKNIEILNQNIQNIKKSINMFKDKIEVLNENKIYYKQAQTDNIMDYTWDMDKNGNILRNPNKRIAFYKPQWEIMIKELKTYYL